MAYYIFIFILFYSIAVVPCIGMYNKALYQCYQLGEIWHCKLKVYICKYFTVQQFQSSGQRFGPSIPYFPSCHVVSVVVKGHFQLYPHFSGHFSLIYASVSIPSMNIPPATPRVFTFFSPGPKDWYHLNCLAVAWGLDLLFIIKVPSCQLEVRPIIYYQSTKLSVDAA